MIIKLLLVIFALYSTNSLGAIFKCNDSSGRMVYSDTACETNANRQILEHQPWQESETQTSFFSKLIDKISGFFNRSSNNNSNDLKSLTARISPTIKPQNFHCDGRTHCSQMTSCDEATFFINNCPDTKMDGNNDGVPCEKQWCQ